MPLAEKWAEQMKDEKVISVLASGPAYGAGHIFSTCNILEMLQIYSPTFNSCDFFHGPFEVLDKSSAMFLLVAEGRTRPADERAIRFLEKFGGKVATIDSKELGIDILGDNVKEYFNHVLLDCAWIVTGQFSTAVYTGYQAVKCAIAIVIGIVFVFELPQAVFKKRNSSEEEKCENQ